MMHWPAWSDDGLVGVRCEKDSGRWDGDTTLSVERDEDEGPFFCPYCGEELRLIWDVSITGVRRTTGEEKKHGR